MQEKVKDAPGSEFKWVGTRAVRPDGVDKVTGRAKFGADMSMQGQLVGKVLRSPHPHARIRSIDVSAAAALPCVKAIVTREDFKDRDDQQWHKHTLCWVDAGGSTRIDYRPVHMNTLTKDVEPIPPKARTY